MAPVEGELLDLLARCRGYNLGEELTGRIDEVLSADRERVCVECDESDEDSARELGHERCLDCEHDRSSSCTT